MNPPTDMNRGEISKVSGILSQRGQASWTESKNLRIISVWSFSY